MNNRSRLLDIAGFYVSVSLLYDQMYVQLGVVPYVMTLLLFYCIFTPQ